MGFGSFFRKLCFGTRKPTENGAPNEKNAKKNHEKAHAHAGATSNLTVINLVKGTNHAAATALKLDTTEGNELCARYYMSAFSLAVWTAQLKAKSIEDLRENVRGHHGFEYVSELWTTLQANLSKLEAQVPPSATHENVQEALSKVAWDGQHPGFEGLNPGFEGFDNLAASVGSLVEELENLAQNAPAHKGPRTFSKLINTNVPYRDDQGVPMCPLTALYIMSKHGLKEVNFDHLPDKHLKNLLHKIAADTLHHFEYTLDKYLAIGPLCLDSVLNWNMLMHEREDDLRIFMLDIMMGITITTVQILELLRDDLESTPGAPFADIVDKIKGSVSKYQLGISQHHYLIEPPRQLALNVVDSPDMEDLLLHNDEMRRDLETGKILMLFSSINADLDNNMKNLLPHAENLRNIYKSEREIARSFTGMDDVVALQDGGVYAENLN